LLPRLHLLVLWLTWCRADREHAALLKFQQSCLSIHPVFRGTTEIVSFCQGSAEQGKTETQKALVLVFIPTQLVFFLSWKRVAVIAFFFTSRI